MAGSENKTLERAAKLADEIGASYGPHSMSGHYDGVMGDACRVVATAIRALKVDE